MDGPPPASNPPSRSGIPPGAIEAVLAILRADKLPMRRRAILKKLEEKGHRISLAGLNRVLEYCSQAGLTRDAPEGLRAVTSPD